MSMSLHRRTFIQQGMALAAASALPASPMQKPMLTDTHVYLGNGPFRTFPWHGTAMIVQQLRQRQVTQAWAGSLDSLLHRDVGAVNARLAAECRLSEGLLLPAGAVNPTLPAWQDDVKRCAQEHGMKVIRLHPNYHGYALDDPRFQELLDLAAANQLLVQIVAQMEDQRTQHPLVQVKPVDLKPLPGLLKSQPKARAMVLNANAAMITTALQGVTNLWLDFAMIEGVGGVENLLKSWPGDKLCFGSFAPVFYWESAKLKLLESGIEGGVLAGINAGNAKAALEP